MLVGLLRETREQPQLDTKQEPLHGTERRTKTHESRHLANENLPHKTGSNELDTTYSSTLTISPQKGKASLSQKKEVHISCPHHPPVRLETEKLASRDSTTIKIEAAAWIFYNKNRIKHRKKEISMQKLTTLTRLALKASQKYYGSN
ncbi:Hypothetical protein NTJ_10818 [Nesidiocoris tenuis]|uniref:Uncharacterized protein n=1 Tax=Nesidiocoris tenuis TaxID=355587 RepID=A0ABN7B182_9HEMI|nr:Hypothetical protein NTJ_10818 [Nesidiocoris tenuis]